MLLRGRLMAVPLAMPVGSRQYDAVLVDELLEVDRGGAVRWRWATQDWAPYDAAQWDPAGRHPLTDCAGFGVRPCRDWSHVNAFYWDIPNAAVYANVDGLGTLVKIDQRSGRVVWAVGRRGGFTLRDRKGHPQAALWSRSCAWEPVRSPVPDRERFVAVDNDYYNVSRPEKPSGGRAVLNGREIRSRLLEVEVDPATQTAREVLCRGCCPDCELFCVRRVPVPKPLWGLNHVHLL